MSYEEDFAGMTNLMTNLARRIQTQEDLRDEMLEVIWNKLLSIEKGVQMANPKTGDVFIAQYPDGYRINEYCEGTVLQWAAVYPTIESAQCLLELRGYKQDNFGNASDFTAPYRLSPKITHTFEDAVLPRETPIPE